MHLEQPWKDNGDQLARRKATIVGLRALADEVEANHYKMENWSSTGVRIGVETLDELTPVMWGHEDDKATATLYNQTLTVSITVAAVESYRNSSIDRVAVLDVEMRAGEVTGDKVLLSWYCSYGDEPEVMESTGYVFSEETVNILHDLFARVGIELVDQRKPIDEATLAESKAKAEIERAAKLVKLRAEQVSDENVEAELEDHALAEADVEPF